MLEEINLLYLKKDTDIDESFFKECLSVTTTQEAKEKLEEKTIGLIVCDLEVEGAKEFIYEAKDKFKDYPLILIEKIPQKKYDFDFTFKMSKPANFDVFRKNIKKHEKEVVEFFEKNLQESVGVSEAIELFFNNKNEAIEKIISATNISKEMDYEIMKSFVNTAYNNFIYIDRKIEKDQLKEIKENFEKIQMMYRNLLRSTDKGVKELYRFIFLENHPEFKKTKTLLEDGKKSLLAYQKRIKNINDRTLEIDKIFDSLEDFKVREQLTQEKKNLKGTYTDIVHNISLLQEVNMEYVKKLESIEEEYFEEFKGEFVLQKDAIKEKYKSLLNQFTFYFNRQLWLAAKRSKPILEYFEQGQVDGMINSKAFLEYYLSKIDVQKAGETTKKMIKYLKNYNDNNRINVAILTTSEDSYYDYAPAINKLDKTINAFHFFRLDQFLKQFQKYNFEIVIIDLYFSVLKTKKALKIIKEALPDNVIITTIGEENPDKSVVFKNFSNSNKNVFQKEFKMIL